MIQVSLKVRPDASALVQAKAVELLKRIVVHYHTALLATLNESNPRPYTTPSALGDPPRKRTGWLQRHVLFEFGPGGLSARVGVAMSARYGLYLELGTRKMKPRPWLVSTLKAEMPRLKQLAKML